MATKKKPAKKAAKKAVKQAAKKANGRPRRAGDFEAGNGDNGGLADADFTGIAIQIEAEPAARVGLLGGAADLAVAQADVGHWVDRGGRVEARRGDGELDLGD